MFIAIIAISYILAINVFGFRIVKIQRADRLKNGDPTPPPQKPKQLESGSHEKNQSPQSETTPKETTSQITAPEQKNQQKTQTKAQQRAATKTKSKSKKESNPNPSHPNNGEKMEKEDMLYEEKLNLKRYERIPDIKILMVAAFGGALGEFISFLIYKYRTTNTLLMVALPVLISVWVYLFYVLLGGFFIV